MGDPMGLQGLRKNFILHISFRISFYGGRAILFQIVQKIARLRPMSTLMGARDQKQKYSFLNLILEGGLFNKKDQKQKYNF